MNWSDIERSVSPEDRAKAAADWAEYDRMIAEGELTIDVEQTSRRIGSTFTGRQYQWDADNDRRDLMPRLPTLSAASFAGKTPPRREWHVEGYIPGRTVTLFSADGGLGKSTLALQLAVATVTATRWLGHDVRFGPVLFLSAEDEADELHRRLAAIIDPTPFGFDDLRDLTFAPLAGHDAILAAPDGRKGMLQPTPLFRDLTAQVAALRPSLVVIDPLADVFGGDEIVKVQARAFIGYLRKLAMDASAAVLLVSHPSLNGLNSGSGTSGNVGWSNSVRSRLYMTRPEEDADLRDIEVMKANYAAAGTKMTVRYDAGRFLPIDAPARKGAAAEQEARYEFLNLLAQFAREGRHVSHQPGPTYAPTTFAKHPAGRGFGKVVFMRAMDRLLADGRIRIETFGPASRQRTRLVEVPIQTRRESAE